MIKTSKTQIALSIICLTLIVISLLPKQIQNPVKGATSNDWHQDTFWYEPWGISGVHKGIDIFAEKSTEIISPNFSLVIYTGEINIGGKVVVTLDSSLRLHYFAHIDEIKTQIGVFVSTGQVLGSVGDSGNAAGKQPHLHYSVVTLIPYLWKADGASQGWKKIFYLNPADYIQQ